MHGGPQKCPFGGREPQVQTYETYTLEATQCDQKVITLTEG